MSETILRARGLRRSFGGLKVLEGVDLELGPGERLALLGANGSGKTTLLRIFATLTLPDAGEAWLGETSLFREPVSARSRLGFMAATDAGFFPRLSGQENLEFFAALRGLNEQELDQSVAPLESVSAFRKALGTPFHLCSSGMRQLLSLGRAMLGRPRLLLLDEPTRSLDPETAESLRRLLAQGLPEQAVIFSTHTETEARQCATRRVFLRQGRLEESPV